MDGVYSNVYSALVSSVLVQATSKRKVRRWIFKDSFNSQVLSCTWVLKTWFEKTSHWKDFSIHIISFGFSISVFQQVFFCFQFLFLHHFSVWAFIRAYQSLFPLASNNPTKKVRQLISLLHIVCFFFPHSKERKKKKKSKIWF